MGSIEDRIERAFVSRPKRLSRLSGGCVADVFRADFEDGSRVVVKSDGSPGAKLDVEGRMLTYLRERSELPVPGVLVSQPDLLIMEFIESDGSGGREAEAHAAECLSALHGVTADRFGFECDTLIGSLDQPNPWTDSWVEFFARHRLMHMALEAEQAGRLSRSTRKTIETLAARLDKLLREPAAPALIHGDVWSGNVLVRSGRLAALIDPAISYSHPEIELAFVTLFSTFGPTFFDAYAARRPIEPGFFEERRDLYNLYPLLVHARLFGGGYEAQAAAIAGRFA